MSGQGFVREARARVVQYAGHESGHERSNTQGREWSNTLGHESGHERSNTLGMRVGMHEWSDTLGNESGHEWSNSPRYKNEDKWSNTRGHKDWLEHFIIFNVSTRLQGPS